MNEKAVPVSLVSSFVIVIEPGGTITGFPEVVVTWLSRCD